MLQSLSPMDLLGLRARQVGASIQIYHTRYKCNMYQITIKLVYKYSDARLMMQSLSPLDLLGLGGT